MNKHIELLASKAGFIFWGDEEWKPEGAAIDWACNYDQEFQNFYKSLVIECAHLAALYSSKGYDHDMIREKICKFYKVELPNEQDD